MCSVTHVDWSGYLHNYVKIVPGSVTELSPQVSAPFDIPEYGSQGTLQSRREEIERAFNSNSGPAKSLLTYLQEAYYSVPIHLALRLQRGGHYVSALDWLRTVYDFTVPEKSPAEKRKIFYGLAQEEKLEFKFQRVEDWLRDPLDPHAIAACRNNTYTRFTLLSIIRCLLEYADAEFTQDTVESLARARTLYMTALELLETEELKRKATDSEGVGDCEGVVGNLRMEIEDRVDVTETQQMLIAALGQRLNCIGSYRLRTEAAAGVFEALTSNATWEQRFIDAQTLLSDAMAKQQAAPALNTVLSTSGHALDETHALLLKVPALFGVATDLASVMEDGSAGASSLASAVIHTASSIVDRQFAFCISPNPVLAALRLKAELCLHKLRTCRNIAGMKREVEPYAAETDQVSGLPQIGANGQLQLPGATTIRPTPYRYSFLIERAKQLVNIAQQMETAMLAALEKRDIESYSRLKAKQDVQLAHAQVKLQTLRVTEAKDQVQLAELQKNKSQVAVDHYTQLVNENINALEAASLLIQETLAMGYTAAAASAALTPGGGAYAGELTQKAAESWANVLAQMASFERRRQQWEFEKSLAEQDVLIGTQQVDIAQDHVRVTEQEREIAVLQTDHAKDTMEFLANKFTNAELYDWMSGVLEGVYSYFLQLATSVAKLAENQLAFERQSTPPLYIQTDYWEPPSEDMLAISTMERKVDRRGLTGSARLLQDIYQLDNYAFETDKRKLQLSKTISLAAMAPIEFQRFREMGVLVFKTPLELFDRDFPGHYLRLIKRVRTSVSALIPPNQGIKATLSTTAASRVVIGGDVFQTVIVRRDPELVALTSPRDASGLFDLQQQPELLLPFEGLGVDTTWELRMPKAANLFDYTTIADVLLTIDYTALNSFDYYQQVIQILRPKLSADRVFSFRHELSDQWYDLHHPKLVEDPQKMVVRWKTEREDFPPNLERLSIQHVVLYFVRASGSTIEVPVTHLHFTPRGAVAGAPPLGGAATSIDGVISTLRGNAGSWMAMQGETPIGEWELSLKDPPIEQWFKKEKIENILFVITYEGRTPDWPA